MSGSMSNACFNGAIAEPTSCSSIYVWPRLTKPSAKRGSSSVTFLNSAIATSNCLCLSASMPAFMCWAAFGDNVCHANHKSNRARITVSPAHGLPGTDQREPHSTSDEFLKAKRFLRSLSRSPPVQNEGACHLRTRSFRRKLQSAFAHSLSRGHRTHHDCCECRAKKRRANAACRRGS